MEAEDKLILVMAHRDRLWKAMGEIEDFTNSIEKQLSGMYKQGLWIPQKERRETDPRAQPSYFDGLARFVERLRPIILGAK